MGKLAVAATLLAVWLALRGRPKPYDVTSHLEDGCRTPLAEGRLYSRTFGAGPDLVLLPGFAGNSQTWEFITPALAREYRVHWLDPLGHGLSDKPADARYDGGAHAARLAAWLDAHDLSRVVVVASSAGAQAAVKLAADYPDRVSGLVLVDPFLVAGRYIRWSLNLRTLIPAQSAAMARRLYAQRWYVRLGQMLGTVRLLERDGGRRGSAVPAVRKPRVLRGTAGDAAKRGSGGLCGRHCRHAVPGVAGVGRGGPDRSLHAGGGSGRTVCRRRDPNRSEGWPSGAGRAAGGIAGAGAAVSATGDVPGVRGVSELSVLAGRVQACRRCPRLVAWREEAARTKRAAYRSETYWGRPVAGFGDPAARVLLVGLAPAAHGGNRTGRVFTGDRSGDFLFAALHRGGFANQAASRQRDDGLELRDAFVTAIVRCAPPANRPSADERAECQPWLDAELDLLPQTRVMVALGGEAWRQLLRVFRQRRLAVPRPAPALVMGPKLRLASGRCWARITRASRTRLRGD